MTTTPAVIAHADWGAHPRKRWRAVARRAPDGMYELDRPELFRGIADLGADAWIGFDFPIGLPRDYAERAGITDFRRALAEFGRGEWERFYELADAADEIALTRPFYPRSAGSKGQHSRATLHAALGLDATQLLRRCELPQPGRPSPNALFWTLGGAQVGRGALRGWREVLAPALEAETIALWPFDGALESLRGRAVVVETYPAEFYAVVLEPTRRWSKRRQEDRRAHAPALLRAAESLGVRVSEALREEIIEGFGARGDGEDRFDAVVGALGMVAVGRGAMTEGVPLDDERVRRVEGWILGRAPAT